MIAPYLRLVASNPEPSLEAEQGLLTRHRYGLAVLRATCARVGLIETELQAIRIALQGQLISPEEALEYAEEIAPGCAAVVAESPTEAS